MLIKYPLILFISCGSYIKNEESKPSLKKFVLDYAKIQHSQSKNEILAQIKLAAEPYRKNFPPKDFI